MLVGTIRLKIKIITAIATAIAVTLIMIMLPYTTSSISNRNNGLNESRDITNTLIVESFTGNDYTVIRIINNAEPQPSRETSKSIINTTYLLPLFGIVSITAIVFIARRIAQKTRIIQLKIKVKPYLVDVDNPIYHVANQSKESNRLQHVRNNEVYIWDKSLEKYSDYILLYFFRTLCVSGIKVIILLKNYPNEVASRIADLIKNNELDKCVEFKYIGNLDKVELTNIIDVDEIIRSLSLRLSYEESAYNNEGDGLNTVSKKSEFNVDKQSQHKAEKYVVIFGRRNRYFLRKELYETLKSGISLNELRKRFGEKTYNLVMDMYNDGVIIMSKGKVFLVE